MTFLWQLTFYNKSNDARLLNSGCGHGDAEIFTVVVQLDVPQHQHCIALQNLVCVQTCSSFVLISW